jgi:CheY-like chemotaxis protein
MPLPRETGRLEFSLQTISFLLVDDERMLHRLTERILTAALVRLNHELRERAQIRLEFQAFSDPNEALNWLLENRPDHIISDYDMPGMHGVQFFRCAHEVFGEHMPLWTFSSSSFGTPELDETVRRFNLGTLEKPYPNTAMEELLVLTWWHSLNTRT